MIDSIKLISELLLKSKLKQPNQIKTSLSNLDSLISTLTPDLPQNPETDLPLKKPTTKFDSRITPYDLANDSTRNILNYLKIKSPKYLIEIRVQNFHNQPKQQI